MEEKRNLSRYCVYTICHTDQLEEAYRDKGGSDTFEENNKWVEGERLFLEAKRNEEQMPILFAAAEKEGGLLYYGILGAIVIDDSDPQAPMTRYSFTRLTPLDKEPPKSSLIKRVITSLFLTTISVHMRYASRLIYS